MRFAETLWHRILRRPYRLAVGETGKGRPVVLLHGLGASQEVWAPLVAQLNPKRWHVITLDLLGFGDSPRPEWNSYSVREHTKSVVATLKQLHIAKPATLIGHSMGCLVAIHVAAKHPRLVKRLILFEPPLFVDVPEFPLHKRRRDKYFAFFEYIAEHPQLAFFRVRWLWRLARRHAGLRLSEKRWVPFRRSLRNTIMSQQAYDELRRISVRTDVIYGRLDFVVIRTQIKDMFRSNRHIHLHQVNRMHAISPRAAKYLVDLLEPKVARKH